MKKAFKLYVVAFLAVVLLFNLIAFIVPTTPENDKFTASFWIGYSLIMVMLAGQFFCVFYAFRADTLKKIFYSVALIKQVYAALILSFIVGGVCMIFSFLPYWIGAIVCAIAFVWSLIAVLKSIAAIDRVVAVDEKIAEKTFFIKSLTVDADTLMASAKSESVKTECRRVCEKIRYSDPMSSPALAGVEAQIHAKFASLRDAVKADNTALATKIADELIVLVDDRNAKCKLFK